MKKLRTLLVKFDYPIRNFQIAAFRGAVVEKVGRNHLLFHQHLGNDQYYYRYPMIQYKSIGNKPAIICLGDGVDEIHNLFNKASWDIRLQDKKVELQIDALHLNTFNLNIGDKMFYYSITNWLALNAENYKKYRAMDGLIEKITFLEKLLTGNILSFAKGIDWHIEIPVKAEIQQLKEQKMIRYKGVPLLAFDVTFRSNVFLPDYLGLGKSVSHGFGVMKQLKNYNE